MILKGRKKIKTSYKASDAIDIVTVSSIINKAMGEHAVNKRDIDYLIDYRNGEQTILHKEKPVREEINNKVVLNHAQMVTRMVVGYFLGTPIQYIQSGDTDKQKAIDMLNRYVQYEDKASTDKEIGDMQSICGTAYRVIFSDGQFADEVPFEDKSLDPSRTFVVYENSISEIPVLGVNYFDVYDDDGQFEGTQFYAYTNYGRWDVLTDNTGQINEQSRFDFSEYNVGGVPIVEYPNNQWRIGDWELMIGLMDAINALHSGRLDDVDQVVQSLLVLINADLDEATYKEMREAGVVSLKSTTTSPSSIQTINAYLDQTGMNMFSGELQKILYALIGIPDRNNRAGGGGDTGQAVELRDGWADLEVVVRNKELSYKRSEKQTLKIILNILNNKLDTNLTLLDIDIKFTRNKNTNMMSKAQTYQMLLESKTLSPSDCLTIVDLVSDVNEYISRGEEFWGESFANKEQSKLSVEHSKVSLEGAKNPAPDDDEKKQGGERAQALKNSKKSLEESDIEDDK